MDKALHTFEKIALSPELIERAAQVALGKGVKAEEDLAKSTKVLDAVKLRGAPSPAVKTMRVNAAQEAVDKVQGEVNKRTRQFDAFAGYKSPAPKETPTVEVSKTETPKTGSDTPPTEKTWAEQTKDKVKTTWNKYKTNPAVVGGAGFAGGTLAGAALFGSRNNE